MNSNVLGKKVKPLRIQRFDVPKSAWMSLALSLWVALTAEIHAQDKTQLPIETSNGESSTSTRLNALGQAFIDNDVWKKLRHQRHAFLKILHQIQEVLVDDHQGILSMEVDDYMTARLNPWGGVDQPHAFKPELPPLTYWNRVPAETPLPEDISWSIPDRYRLAEAMRIGTNSVHIEVSAEDGELFANVDAGYHIGQRVRHSLIGQFWLKGENLPVRVFHHSILSRGRLNTQDILLGSEVKPHQFTLQRRPVEALYRTGLGNRIWKEERLDLRFPEGFNEVLQSPEVAKAQHALELRVEQSIQKRLKVWRQKRIAFQWEQLMSMHIPDRLDALRLDLIEWESVHGDGVACTMSSLAKNLINAEQLHQRIQSQVQDAHPWLLEQVDMKRLEFLFNASIAHGLYHRVPESARESVLLCWLAIAKEALWAE
jgi:hypothetical protein